MCFGSEFSEARSTDAPPAAWSRLAGQPCRIPNNQLLSLHAGSRGCFVLQFSHDGKSIACASQERETYPLFIYKIPSGELIAQLSGHFGIVYDVCWSRNDKQLLTASSDGTVRYVIMHL